MVFALVSSVGDDVKWQSAIERALGTWESVVEWADYISFLARVQKAVKNKQRCDGSQLPLASQISEMLAMCLDPSLPAGVHQMCIDVYDTIFTIVGPAKLTETINIWLPGLLPVVSWSAFNVKPLLLQLFHKHIIPAIMSNPDELRELYRPLLLALLPSIEDEAADCFSEICELLNILKSKQKDGEFFWRCFYLCILTSPDSRMGALTFLHKNTPHLDDSGFLVRAVCCGLEDSNVLVQRGFLDLLANYLPLDSPILQKHPDDFDKLILSACRTIFRKDMSLNRRLRLWLLGPDPDSPNAVVTNNITRLEYLKKYAAERLTAVMLQELDSDAVAACIIAQGLTDRWELGAVLAPALLTPVLLQSRKMNNVPKAFEAFFDNIESSVVWSTVIKLLETDPEAVLFMVKHYDIKDEEMLKRYIPLVVLYILCGDLTDTKSDIVIELLKVLPPQDLPAAPPTSSTLSAQDFVEIVPKFMRESYERGITGEHCEVPVVNPKNVSWYLAKLAGDVVLRGGSAEIVNRVLGLIPPTPGLMLEIPQSDKLIQQLDADSQCGVELFTHLEPVMTPLQVRKYVQSLVQDLSETILNDGHRQMEKVQDLWRVNDVLGGLVVSSSLSRVLADKIRFSAFDRARIYAGVWSNSLDQADINTMLTKPTLLFLDIAMEDKSLFGAYVQSGVVRTGTAHRFVKLLVDKLDSEAKDDYVLSYILERFIIVLRNPEIKSAYISKFAPLVSTLILEWFDKNTLAPAAYSNALELAEITVLDHRIKDGKVWLRRFSDALINSYIEQKEGDMRSVPVSLMKFITAAVPLLEQKDDIRLFAEVCVRNLESEVDYEGYGQLLQALLHSNPMVEEGLLQCIVAKLSQLDGPLLSSSPEDMGTSSGILHLVAAIESILVTGLKYVKEHTQHTQSSGGLTSAIAGFHLESPEDRSLAMESEARLDRCIQIAIHQSCKYWLFLQRTRENGGNGGNGGISGISSSTITFASLNSSTTALHTAGRLKTRLRKLMFLCHSTRAAETLKGVAANIADPCKAVRMIHMFEGSRQKITLELLFKLALEDSEMFDVAVAYVTSLETDLLSDIWPMLQSFLTSASQSNNNTNNSKALQFIVDVIVPRIERLKLKNRKKLIKDFSDTYAKLLLSTDTSDAAMLSSAIQQMPAVVQEQESQAQLLYKVFNALFKTPKDISRHISLLQTASSTFGLAGSPPTKIWARIVGDFILETRTENDIIPLNLDQSLSMAPVVNAWVSCDKERVKDFVTRVATYGSSNVLFGWSGTQLLADANLRRLAYMTICSTPSSLAVNWSKVTNQLAGLWPQNSESVCFLLRACILNQVPSTLMTFMTFRLQSIFRATLARTEPISGHDAKLLLEACKLVDLALTVNLEQFQAFEWLFISDNGDVVYSRENTKNDEEKDEEKATGSVGGSSVSRAGGILEKLVDSPAIPQTVYQQLDTPVSPYRGKRRPLLPPRAQFSDIPAFLSRVSLTAHEGVYAVAQPDMEYCREWVLSDMFASNRE